MMPTDSELRAEAERLVDLDERGELVDEVAAALRLGRDSEQSTAYLQRIDKAFLRSVLLGEPLEEFLDELLG